MTRTRVKIELFSAIILVLVGCFLLIAGIFIPPMSVIHPSVLVTFGEMSVFAGSLFGINLHYKIELSKFKSDLGIDRNKR